MKKNMIIAAALILICLTNLLAQDGSTINTLASKSFEKKFSGATDVQWQPPVRGVSLARFHYRNEAWLAYFGIEGNLITSGRKVKSPDALPIKVRESLERSQGKYETKYGAFTLGGIYEMVSEEGATSYFVPLQSREASIMLSISSEGNSVVRKKELLAPNRPDPSAIAKN